MGKHNNKTNYQPKGKNRNKKQSLQWDNKIANKVPNIITQYRETIHNGKTQ